MILIDNTMIPKENNPSLLRQEYWNLLRFDLNWAYERHAQTGFDYPYTYQYFYTAFYISSGQLNIRKGNKSIAVHSGEWIFIPPGRIAKQMKIHSQYTYIGFFMSWTGQGNLVSPLQNQIWKLGKHPILEEKTVRLCQSVAEKEKTEYYLYEKEISMKSHFEFRCLFDDWVRIWLGMAEEKKMGWSYIREVDERLVPIASHLKTMPTDIGLDINRLAREAGLSRPQFFRLFQKQYGTTPKAYRDQFRLRHAIQQLLNSKKEIKEIASLFGYNTPQFDTWIKRHTHKTPSLIRKEGLTSMALV